MFLAGRSKRERKVETDSYMRGYWKQPADTIRIKCESRAFTIVVQTDSLPEPEPEPEPEPDRNRDWNRTGTGAVKLKVPKLPFETQSAIV